MKSTWIAWLIRDQNWKHAEGEVGGSIVWSIWDYHDTYKIYAWKQSQIRKFYKTPSCYQGIKRELRFRRKRTHVHLLLSKEKLDLPLFFFNFCSLPLQTPQVHYAPASDRTWYSQPASQFPSLTLLLENYGTCTSDLHFGCLSSLGKKNGVPLST